MYERTYTGTPQHKNSVMDCHIYRSDILKIIKA